MEKVLHSADETLAFGEMLGQNLEGGLTIVLNGDLGTGKTTLTQGLGKGLGIKQLVKSPTYTLIREYDDGRVPLYHMDVYRLEGSSMDLGLDEYFESQGICVVEWGQLIVDELPNQYLNIDLIRENDDARKIVITGHNMEIPQFLN